jgi:predicted esterase
MQKCQLLQRTKTKSPTIILLTASYECEAAINKLDEMGVGDKNRVAVGGHSYGAFMTANLLAHTKLFKAGIARSGAYNRSLTPLVFRTKTVLTGRSKIVLRHESVQLCKPN